MKQTTRAIVWFALLALLVATIAAPSCGDDDDDGDQEKAAGDDDDSAADDDSADGGPSGDFTCDGVVCTDSLSGLIWQHDADCCYDWQDAKTYCENLDLGGYSDWRLPSLDELRTLVRGCDATVTGGDCTVTGACLDFACRNTPCNGCDYYSGPGTEGRYWPEKLADDCLWYWSSSPVTDRVNYAWYVEYNGASIQNRDVWTIADVRCVQ